MTARLESLRVTISRLRESLEAPETDLSRDAAIQRFEFCFELAWKAIQERAREEGLDCQSPKGCFKLAFKTGRRRGGVAGHAGGSEPDRPHL